MKQKLGHIQNILFALYKDCKARSRKRLEMNNVHDTFHSDEELIRFMLGNTSIVDSCSERSYHKTRDAISNICHQMCPGVWCTRYHCRYNDSRKAYNCGKTRPAVCQDYKKYIDKKTKRQHE